MPVFYGRRRGISRTRRRAAGQSEVMNRMLDFLRGRLAGPPDATDQHLLARFLDDRDEAAFAEVVRRHGPLVWGVCRRRLANAHDAEDAFQATFLVLVRRAASLGRDVPLGPWLHRVAVMTTRNVARGNRRRSAVTGPMEHDVPAPPPPEAALDLDAALLALPERERAAVVLCHLQGFTRKEAAGRLGCPEGTLSARLSRALARLRMKLAPAAVVVPVGLSAGTVRAAAVSLTSSLTAAGVGPAVAGLTNGVLRMFWVKKAVAAAVVALACGGLVVGIASAQKDGPPGARLPTDPPSDPVAEARRLAAQLEQLKKQQADLERGLKLVEEAAAKEALRERDKRAELDRRIRALLPADVLVAITTGQGGPQFTIREKFGGKIGELLCSDVDVLETYLTRAFAHAKGPKTIAIAAGRDTPPQTLHAVFAACASAGFKKATYMVFDTPALRAKLGRLTFVEEAMVDNDNPPIEVDTSKYGPVLPMPKR
jgi:RNA polymerase sigma factor (sigma-70 family)